MVFRAGLGLLLTAGLMSTQPWLRGRFLLERYIVSKCQWRRRDGWSGATSSGPEGCSHSPSRGTRDCIWRAGCFLSARSARPRFLRSSSTMLQRGMASLQVLQQGLRTSCNSWPTSGPQAPTASPMDNLRQYRHMPAVTARRATLLSLKELVVLAGMWAYWGGGAGGGRAGGARGGGRS